MIKKLCVLLLLMVCVSCAPKKKVVIAAPETIGGDVVYKDIPEEQYTKSKSIISEALLQEGTVLVHPEIHIEHIFCGPFLWRELKNRVPDAKTMGKPVMVMVPNLNSDNKKDMGKYLARLMGKADGVRLLEYVTDYLGGREGLTIRKLTESELKLYWTFISWDIEEPVFMIENNDKTMIVDFELKEGKLVLNYIEDYTLVIERWGKIHNVKKDGDTLQKLTQRYEMSEAVFKAEKLAEDRKKLYGGNSLEYALALGSLGSIYSYERRYNDAEKNLLKAEKIFTFLYGTESTYLSQVYSSLSAVYTERDEFTKAEGILLKSIAMAKKLKGEKNFQVGIGYSSLAILYNKMKRYEDALKCHSIAEEIFTIKYGDSLEEPNMAIMYNNYGETYFYLTQYDNAHQYYSKAESILLKVLGEKHDLTIGIRGNKGRVLVYLKKYTEAEPLLLNLLENKTKKFGKKSKELKEGLESLVKLYAETSNKEKEVVYREWLDSLEKK